MSTEANKAIAQRFFEAFSHGDTAAFAAVVHPEIVSHSAPQGLPAGIEGYHRLSAMYRTAFADLTMTVDDMLADDDKVATRFTARGTHRGELAGVAPTGKQVAVGAISIIRVADGKVVEEWDQLDRLGLQQQVGASPTPEDASA